MSVRIDVLDHILAIFLSLPVSYVGIEYKGRDADFMRQTVVFKAYHFKVQFCLLIFTPPTSSKTHCRLTLWCLC